MRFCCIGCGRAASRLDANCRCGHCGDLLEITVGSEWLAGRSAAEWKQVWLQRRMSNDIADRSGVWRFREILPNLRNPRQPVSLGEGNTPLYELRGETRQAGLERLWAKHQGSNPTGSFKDTGMTVAVSRAREEGHRWLACASTGNTAASMAAYAAHAGLRSLVLVPEGKVTWSKLAQSLDYGALTLQLRTDFDGCVTVLDEVSHRAPVYLANSVNPFRVEGQKTAAVELLETLKWEAPNHVIVPGGNLANASAIGKAFRELHAWGFVERLPRISIIQAEGANPLVRTMREEQGRKLVPVEAETLASAIRIGKPASWKKAVRVLEETKGICIDVSEAEIAEAKATLGREGVACEPASAAALAGARKLARQGFIGREESVVLILTGHGLKDPDYTLAFHRGELSAAQGSQHAQRATATIEATAEAVLDAMNRDRA